MGFLVCAWGCVCVCVWGGVLVCVCVFVRRGVFACLFVLVGAAPHVHFRGVSGAPGPQGHLVYYSTCLFGVFGARTRRREHVVRAWLDTRTCSGWIGERVLVGYETLFWTTAALDESTWSTSAEKTCSLFSDAKKSMRHDVFGGH